MIAWVVSIYLITNYLFIINCTNLLQMTTIDLPVILLSAAVTVATGRKAEVVTDRLTDILNGRWRY